MPIENMLWLIAAIIFFWWLIGWISNRRSRLIPEEVKKAVIKRFNGECAVCSENRTLDIHHRKQFSDGGDNSFENLVALCPTHHAMVTRRVQ